MNNLRTWAFGGRGHSGRADAPPDARAVDFDDDVRAWIEEEPKAFSRPDNPPAWVKSEAIWDRAKAAVEPNWASYSEPWAVVAHVYEQMGGT